MLVVIAAVAAVILAATMVAIALPSLFSSANAISHNTNNDDSPPAMRPSAQVVDTPVIPSTTSRDSGQNILDTPNNPSGNNLANNLANNHNTPNTLVNNPNNNNPNNPSGRATATNTNSLVPTNTFSSNPTNTNTNNNTNELSQSIQSIQINPIVCTGGTVVNNQCTCGGGTHLNAAGNGCDPNPPTPTPIATACSQTNPTGTCPSGQMCLSGTCGTNTPPPLCLSGSCLATMAINQQFFDCINLVPGACRHGQTCLLGSSAGQAACASGICLPSTCTHNGVNVTCGVCK